MEFQKTKLIQRQSTTGGRETTSLVHGDNGLFNGNRRNADPEYYDDGNDGTDLAQVRQASDRASQVIARNPERDEGSDEAADESKSFEESKC